MNDDSRSRHSSSLGSRSDDDTVLDLVEQDNQQHQKQRQLSLAQLYRKAKERGLVLPHTQYR
jgi:hypothetical protein